MIQINKEEATAIRKRYPDIPIKRTVHRWYVEEHPKVLALLRRGIHKKRS